MIKSKVFLWGNLGQEVEVRYTPQGTFVANTSIGVDTGYGDKKETSWFKLAAWGKAGEMFNKLCKKGTAVMVEGRLKIRQWEDDKGVKHTSVEVDVTDFNVIARGKDKEEGDALPEDENPF